jgi:hypothetical protein
VKKRKLMKSLIAVFFCLFIFNIAHGADTVPLVIDQPGTQPREIGNLESPDKCDNCHGGYNTATEPAHNWRGSMMANAGRDPIFWATVAIAEQDFDGAGDLCIRCHSTSGWLAGRSTPTDGSGLAAGDSDGVDCDFCHQVTNPDNSETNLQGVMNDPYIANDGQEGWYGSGMASIWGGSDKLGPYDNAEARHKFIQSKFIRSVDFCGTCHDVSNPAVGNLAHNFGAQITAGITADGALDGSVDTKAAFNNAPYKYGVVERTFSEYKSGLISQTLVDDYLTLPQDLQGGALEAIYNDATEGGTKSANFEDGDPRYYSCQSCHMRPVFGQGCNKNPPFRNDLALHDMTGGNYWMPEAILYLDTQDKLRLGGGLSNVQIDAINDGKLRAKQQLNLAASLSVTGNTLKIVNHTGHKLISGYPEGRRMWLNIKWYDGTTLLREDGKYGKIDTIINGNPAQVDSIIDLHDTNTKIYEAHYGMSQEWAAQLSSLGYDDGMILSFNRTTGTVTHTLGDLVASANGTELETFHFVLNNVVLKDNRIPPYGMSYDTAQTRNSLPVPADQYGNPGTGGAYNYWDEFALNPPAGANSATIDLLYQPTSWEYIQFLNLANKGQNAFLANEGTYMLEAWLNTGMAAPYVMASTSWGNAQPSCTAPVPTILSAVPGNSEATLTWSDEHTGDVNIEGYNVYYDQAGKAQLVAQTGLTTTYTDTGLTNGQVYCYKLTSRYDATCESDFSQILCATPNNSGQARVGVSTLTTGIYETTGKGKNKTTTFVEQSIFNAGDAVTLRALVLDASTLLPVQNAVVELVVSGPATVALTSNPSDANGFAEVSWQTEGPNKRGQGGTATGSYTATVIDVAASGYSWDQVMTTAPFTLQ